jgi:integrase
MRHQAPKALTVNSLERLETRPAPASRQEIPDGLLTGLYLVRQPSKAMSWVVRYRHRGGPRKLTLGRYPAIGLKAARDLGAKALRAAAEGRDPAREKQEAKGEAKRAKAEEIRGQRDLYENVAREFITRHAMQNTRESTCRETARILGFTLEPSGDGGELVEVPAGGEAVRDVLDAFKGRRVQEIAKRDIIILLDNITDRGAKTMANRTLAAVRKLFNWAVSRDILTISPCTGVVAPASESSRDRVLDDDELRLVWNAAGASGWPYGPIFKLMALTGQREGEVTGMRWDELDLEGKLWTLPANRVKNDEKHTVPLSDAAIEIIKALPRIKSPNHFVFPGRSGKPVSSFSRAKEVIDAKISKANEDKPLADWVPHDLRRTVASGMARLGIQLPVIEKVLNHKSGTFRGIVAVYQRHSFADEKRAALAAWASHVEMVVSGKQPANVIVLRPGA